MGSIVAEIADKIASAGGGERSELEVRGGTGADGGGTLTLSTSELTVVDGDILGRIDFQAPLETGADAILVGASIYAEADDTFAADNNSTELVFATGASEAAAEKMRITSDGKVGIGTATPVTDLTVEGPITIKEQAAADADTAAYGQIWVDDAVPNQLYFTNDAGNDIALSSNVLLGSKNVTSSAASTTSTSYVATGLGTSSRDLDITVPEAVVALYSKIIVVVSHMILINGGSTFAYADAAVFRGGSIMNGRHIIGSTTATAKQHSITRVEIDASPPGSGDAVYSYRIRKHNGAVSYAGGINVLGAETDTTAVILAYGVV